MTKRTVDFYDGAFFVELKQSNLSAIIHAIYQPDNWKQKSNAKTPPIFYIVAWQPIIVCYCLMTKQNQINEAIIHAGVMFSPTFLRLRATTDSCKWRITSLQYYTSVNASFSTTCHLKGNHTMVTNKTMFLYQVKNEDYYFSPKWGVGGVVKSSLAVPNVEHYTWFQHRCYCNLLEMGVNQVA